MFIIYYTIYPLAYICTILCTFASLCNTMASGSSRGKGAVNERRKDGGKLTPMCFDGPLGPDFFEEAVFNFPVQSKKDFNKEVRLRSTIIGEKIGRSACMVRIASCRCSLRVELMEVVVSSDVLMHM